MLRAAELVNVLGDAKCGLLNAFYSSFTMRTLAKYLKSDVAGYTRQFSKLLKAKRL